MWNQDRFYGIYRQASGIIPKNVTSDNEYIELEMKYRDVRTQTHALAKHLEEMKTYEHGGPTYKTILESLEKVKGKQKVDEDEDLSDNMYNVGEQIFDMLAKHHYKSEYRKDAEKLANASRAMSRTKHEFNKKIKELMKTCKTLKKLSVEIDDERTKMKNVQFKAERAYEAEKTRDANSDPKTSPGVRHLMDEFNDRQSDCKNSMKNFLENKGHDEILQGLLNSYVVHFESALVELKK